jgi:hypothetical protein
MRDALVDHIARNVDRMLWGLSRNATCVVAILPSMFGLRADAGGNDGSIGMRVTTLCEFTCGRGRVDDHVVDDRGAAHIPYLPKVRYPSLLLLPSFLITYYGQGLRDLDLGIKRRRIAEKISGPLLIAV